MIYSKDVEKMCTVKKGVDHGPAPIPEEGKWVKAKEIKDKQSFIDYINLIDSNNLNEYVKVIEFYNENSIHNVYKISAYIFEKIENKLASINSIYNYFVKSISTTINKFNNYDFKKNIEEKPEWLYKEIKGTKATKEEQLEMEKLLEEFRR